MKNRLLLIEDDDRLRRILQLVLEGAGYAVATAADGKEGIAVWRETQPNLVLTDLKMSPVDGLVVLRFGKKYSPRTPIIIITAFGTVENAVFAMKDGAFDYLTKPIDNDELLNVVEDALAEQDDFEGNSNKLIGFSASMDEIKRNIQLFSSTDSSVLINGESGTGKELAARSIHRASKHADGPFIRVNCAAIPTELMESELFGHIKGAFTGSTGNRKGAFAMADKGTLFLDEIGDLPLSLQPKLLHAVEEKTITPIGSNTPKSVNVKILSATNQDLLKMIAEKTFRQDLYYRLNQLQLCLPPVREREGDLLLLLDHFLNLFSKKFSKDPITFTQESITLLQSYSWPGNVRELRNIVERATLTCAGSTISPANLPSSIQTNTQLHKERNVSISTDLNGREEELITTVLQDCNWNQSQAARVLGVTRNTLRYRIKKFDLKK